MLTTSRAAMLTVAVAVVLAASLLGGSGCSLLTSFDGFATNADAAPGSSSGPGSVEAGADGSSPFDANGFSLPDGATTLDAGDGDGGDGGAMGCSSLGPHGFCADFDQVTDVVDGWNRFNKAPGTAALDTDFFLSPGRSAVLRIPANSGSCAYAEIVKVLPGSFKKATLKFNVRVGTAAANVPANPHYIAGLGINNTCTVFYKLYGTVAVYRQDDNNTGAGEYISLPQATPISVGAWHSVTLTFSTMAAPYIVGEVDGVTLASITTLPSGCQVTGAIDIRPGFHCAPNNPSDLEERIDNVTLDGE